jgi:hypothetical protein
MEHIENSTLASDLSGRKMETSAKRGAGALEQIISIQVASP